MCFFPFFYSAVSCSDSARLYTVISRVQLGIVAVFERWPDNIYWEWLLEFCSYGKEEIWFQVSIMLC